MDDTVVKTRKCAASILLFGAVIGIVVLVACGYIVLTARQLNSIQQARGWMQVYYRAKGIYPSCLSELYAFAQEQMRERCRVPEDDWKMLYYVTGVREEDPEGLPVLISAPRLSLGGFAGFRRWHVERISETDVACLVSNPCFWTMSAFSNEQAYAECVGRVRVVDWVGNPIYHQ